MLFSGPHLQNTKLNLERNITKFFFKCLNGEKFSIHINPSPVFVSPLTEVYLQCRVLKVQLQSWKPCRGVLFPLLFGSCDVPLHWILEIYIQLHEAVVVTSQPPEYIDLHLLKCAWTSDCKGLPDLVFTQVSVLLLLQHKQEEKCVADHWMNMSKGED
jgi:hypothetical protein